MCTYGITLGITCIKTGHWSKSEDWSRADFFFNLDHSVLQAGSFGMKHIYFLPLICMSQQTSYKMQPHKTANASLTWRYVHAVARGSNQDIGVVRRIKPFVGAVEVTKSVWSWTVKSKFARRCDLRVNHRVSLIRPCHESQTVRDTRGNGWLIAGDGWLFPECSQHQKQSTPGDMESSWSLRRSFKVGGYVQKLDHDIFNISRLESWVHF